MPERPELAHRYRQQTQKIPALRQMAARRQLLAQIPVSDLRAGDGTPLFDGLRDPRRIADSTDAPQTMEFTRPGLSEDFILCMRHHALYTAALPTLLEFGHFRIIAVIRNPVDILLSWQHTPALMLAPSDQHGLSAMWPQAHKVTASDMPALDKMAQLAELFFQRYHEWQEHIDIVKYEHFVQNPLSVSHLFDMGKPPANASNIVAPPQARRAGSGDEIRKALRKYAVFAKKFYPDM